MSFGKLIGLFLCFLTIYTSIYYPVASYYVLFIDFIAILLVIRRAIEKTHLNEAKEILKYNNPHYDPFRSYNDPSYSLFKGNNWYRE